MEIEFDPAKNRSNLAAHGIDLGFARELLEADNRIEIVDTRRDYGEERMLVYAELRGTVFMTVHVRRGTAFRIISCRRANRRERERYRQA